MPPKDDKKGKRGSDGGALESKRQKSEAPAPPPERPRERERRLDRTLFVLTLVLERHRQRDREHRLDRRRELQSFSEEACDPRETEWLSEGEDDADGEAGAVEGDGWLARVRGGAAGQGAGILWGGFICTLVAASRVCRAWRAAAFHAADRASVSPSALPAALAAYGGGGVLRALRVKGAPPPLDGTRDARAFSRELGAAARDPAALRVASGLRLPAVDHAADVLAALPAGGSRGTSAASRPPLLSRANFPALRVLDLAMHPDSDCPLQLVGGSVEGSGDDGAGPFSPPFLTRLRVDSKVRTPPSGRRWPPFEPLLVSLRSLAALGPTLRSLSAGQPWGTGGLPEGEGGEDEDEDAPRVFDIINSRNDPPPARVAPLSRLLPGLGTLSQLTSLELETEIDWFSAGVWGLTHSDPDGLDQMPVKPELRAAKRARQSEWGLASRAVLQPCSTTLRRLTIEARNDMSEGVALPPAISTLTALTSLLVHYFRLDSVGPLRKLPGLRVLRLEVVRSEWDLDYPFRPPALGARDLRPLTALEELALLSAPSSVAPVIKRGLPALKSLMLCGDESEWNRYNDWEGEPFGLPRPEPPLPLRVLRAAQRRKRSMGLTALMSGSKEGEGAKEIDSRAIDRLIKRMIAALGDTDDNEDDDDDEEEEESAGTEGGGDDDDEGGSGGQ